MKISFLIPSKEGGEGFERLLDSINLNINHAHESGHCFDYEIIFIINGDPTKPLSYLDELRRKKYKFETITVGFSGKAKSINYALEHTLSDLVVILDDDIFFNGKNLILNAINNLTRNPDLNIIGFKNRAVSYPGGSFFGRISYDVINIRSLKDLYKDIDPFLFGRLLVVRRKAINIPDNIINEDLYLSISQHSHYLILPEEVFYIGERSLLSHVKRVLRIEAGRKQIRGIYGIVYDQIMSETRREIDKEKLRSCSVYYKMCYRCYRLLRFFTNAVISRFVRHKTNYW